MARCAGCPGIQGSLHTKLGTCARCMRIAAAGTLSGWGLVVAARAFGAPRGVVGLLLLVAAQFSLVLVLHLMAKLGRVVFETTGRGRGRGRPIRTRLFVTPNGRGGPCETEPSS